MLRRSASNPVDLIGGMLYLCKHDAQDPTLRCGLPTYIPSEEPGKAWERLVHAVAQVLTTMCECISCEYADGPFTIQLMRLFPHPSRAHWFPSWSQVLQFPDVSVREPQRPDGEEPDADLSLRIYGGMIHHGIKLVQYPEMKSFYIASGLGEDGQPRKSMLISLVTSAGPTVDLSGPPPADDRIFNKNSATHSLLDGLIDPDYPYVLLNLAPCRPHSSCPAVNTQSVVVCREITPWKSPAALRGKGEVYEYRLRRVTTLDVFDSDHEWLPFKSALEMRLSDTTYLYSWDSPIKVMLQ